MYNSLDAYTLSSLCIFRVF